MQPDAIHEFTLRAFARTESADWIAATYGGRVIDRAYRLQPDGARYQLVLIERVAVPAGHLAWHWTVRAIPRESLEGSLEVVMEVRAIIGQVTIPGEPPPRPEPPRVEPEPPEPPTGEAPELPEEPEEELPPG